MTHGHATCTEFVIGSVRYYDASISAFRAADIKIGDGVIKDISHPGGACSENLIDGRDLLCLPGLVNAHLHPSKETYQGLYEGNASTQLMDAVHKNNRAETSTTQANATLYSLAKSVLQGITSVGIFTSRAEIDALQAKVIGIRAAIFYAQNDRWEGGGERPEVAELGTTMMQFDNAYRRFDTDLITINPATASEFSASDVLLRTFHQMARRLNRRFSMHIQEGQERVAAFRRMYYEGAIKRLHRLSILDRHTTLIHASSLSEADLENLAGSAVSLVHCPISNSFTSAGKMPLRPLLDGHSVGLGTDSAMINPLNRLAFEASFAAYFHGESDERMKVTVSDVIRMLTEHGAQSINVENCGRLEPGMKADLCLFDDVSPQMSSADLHLLDLYLTRRPREVLVAGLPVVSDYKLRSASFDLIQTRFLATRNTIASTLRAAEMNRS